MCSVVQDFTHILIKDRKDNTYKFALARFLLDYIWKMKPASDVKISYEKIAEAFLKYYWNQIVVYKIKQDFKTKKLPQIVTLLTERTLHVSEHFEPFFKKEENIFLKHQLIDKIHKTCLKDVIPRFQRENKQNIYSHNVVLTTHTKTPRYYLPAKEKQYIVLKKSAIQEILRSHSLLFETLILEWARFLEKTNFTPRLIQKVERISNPQRSSLFKFKKLLSTESNVCFYCGKSLSSESNKIHVDHFIPWSYVFEDDVLNLVLSCDSCNLKKSNRLVSKKYLNKLLEYKLQDLSENEQAFAKKKLIEYYDNCKAAGFLSVTLP